MSAAPDLTRTDARARAELLEVTAYQVELDLTDGAGRPGERTFRSHTTVASRARHVGASTFVDLIAGGIRMATLNGTPLATSDYASEDRPATPGARGRQHAHHRCGLRLLEHR